MLDWPLIVWLLGPIDPSRSHFVAFHQAWHGRAMVVAWGVLVPIGVIAARFFKVLPRQRFPEVVDNRTWFVTHQFAQWSSLALMAVGMGLVWYAPIPQASATAAAWVHHWLGWAIIAFGVSQGVSALFRGTHGGPTDRKVGLRGDHYDMTRRRRTFERVHKTFGYSALALAIAAIMSGMWQANAPRWMWLILSFWWAAIATLFVLFQRRGMVIDTYTAIWGYDPTHPGNARRDHHPGE